MISYICVIRVIIGIIKVVFHLTSTIVQDLYFVYIVSLK